MLVCKLNLRKKDDENLQSIFQVNVLKLKVRFAEKDKVIKKMFAGVGLEPNHIWVPCCEPWLKFEVEALRCKKKNVWVVDYPVSWAPCCERTKSWVLCCNELETS